MSKFVERLQSFSKSSSGPIGFQRAALEAKTPTMLLIVALSGEQVGEAQAAAAVKADAALIVGQVPAADSLKQMTAAAGDVPLGILLKGANEERASELAGSGCDFVVLDTQADAATLQKEGVGRLLIIEPSLDQGLIRAINNLEIDGVLISAGEGSHAVSVEQLLIARRFVELLAKPVILMLSSSVSQAALAGLAQAGVEGIVAPPGQSAGALAELKKAVDSLPRPARGRRATASVRLPHYGGVPDTDDDAEEDED